MTLALACATGALLVVAPSAGAAPIEREHYSGSEDDTFVETECGDPMTLDYHVDFEGLFMLKQGRRGDPTPYFFDNYSSVETYTNVDNGKTGTITHNGMWKDLKIELIEGTVYRFTALEPGRPIVVIGPDGERLVFDAGRVFWTFVVDTMGDSDLGNDIFLEEPTPDWAGPHPVLEGLDFCDFVDVLR